MGDKEKLQCFFVELELGYAEDVPYHNRMHAACVLHSMYTMTTFGQIGDSVLDVVSGGEPHDLEMLACLHAAAVHDFEHKGLTNDFLVKTRDPRAVLYNDRHVNENHHFDAALALLCRPECNFLVALLPADFLRFRNLVGALVLGTDMADHGDLVKTFGETMRRDARDPAHALPCDWSASCVQQPARPWPFRPASKAGAILALQVALKCADIGHLALECDLHEAWVRRLEEELFAQGDREKALDISPVTFLADRTKPGVSQTQLGFFDHVVIPFFQLTVSAFPGTRPMFVTLTDNR